MANPVIKNARADPTNDDPPRTINATYLATTRRLTNRTAILWLGGIGALCYLSWPLGYVVNSSVVVGGLASDLEVPGQPYWGLFVGLDIVSGIAMVLVAFLLWRGMQNTQQGFLLVCLGGYGAFGVSSILGAAVPLSCGTGRASLLACGTEASSYGWHDLVGLLGYLAFFVTLVGSVRRTWSWPRCSFLTWVTLVVGILWSLSGILFMAVTLAHGPEVPWQHVLLALTSMAIFIAPLRLAASG